MQDPWTRVICPKPDGNVIVLPSYANNITSNGVIIVVDRAPCTAYNVEGMLDDKNQIWALKQQHHSQYAPHGDELDAEDRARSAQ